MPYFAGSKASIYYEQTGSGPDIVWVGGGGTQGHEWHMFQTPYFDANFRSTVFDNRGIGRTTCDEPLPWPLEDFAADLAELVKSVCNGPVFFIGSSLGSAIIQEVAITYPELVHCAIVMGTGARSSGWSWDYQEAEIEFRKRGGKLDGMMGVTHYASMLYPARVLGDPVLWPKLKALMMDWMGSGENEGSLIAQWDASLRFDQTDRLCKIRSPVHVIIFNEDIQASPQEGEELVQLIPNAEGHLMMGMGHGSWFGHAQDTLNPLFEQIMRRYI